jgi:molecular chaperone DnaJ
MPGRRGRHSSSRGRSRSRSRHSNSSTTQLLLRHVVQQNAQLQQHQWLQQWLQQVYGPIDRLLAQVINPFPAQLKALSADPYDDTLMESFCAFLEQGQARVDKVELLYRSQVCPPGGQAFALDLYHCLSLVKDALTELERYTLGYVDSYLHDGRELLKQARLRRQDLQSQRRELGI